MKTTRWAASALILLALTGCTATAPVYDPVRVTSTNTPLETPAVIQGAGEQEYLTTLRENMGADLDGVSDDELLTYARTFCATLHNENGADRAMTALITDLPTKGREASLALVIGPTAAAHMCPEFMPDVQKWYADNGFN